MRRSVCRNLVRFVDLSGFPHNPERSCHSEDPKMPVKSISRQIRGTVSNVFDTFGDISPLQLLPPAFRSTLVWARDMVPRGLGFAEDRGTHFTASWVFFGMLLVTTGWWFTLLAIVYFFASSVAVGIRFIPFVEKRWPFHEGNWPFWTVKDGV